jgi:hypothetical protein
MERRKKLMSKIGLTLLTFIMTTISCDNKDFLEPRNENQLTPDTFWQSEADAEKAIVGAYSPLSNVYGWGRMMILHTVYRSDVVDPIPFQGVTTDASNFSITPNFGRLIEIWGEFWKTIFRANLVLENVPNIEDANFTDQERDFIIGQAYFLRGFQYFYLITMFRNVPLLTEAPKSLDNVSVAPSDPALVWEQIISDFKMAQNLLPDVWDIQYLGKATSGAATGMLGKTYLYRAGIENNSSDFGLAAAEFEKIINSGRYSLIANYSDNFTATNENNSESLFEIQHDINGLSWGADNTSTLRAAAWEPDMAPPPFTSQNGFTINKWAFDIFMEEPTVDGEIDPRSYSTFIWNYPGAKIYQEEFADAYAGNLNFIGGRKYLDFDTPGKPQSDFGFAGYPSPINWRILRYADVLLMYAEAANESGGPTPAALTAVNQVRERANMASITNTDQVAFREIIRRERVLELSLEGTRYYDLLRWGMIPSRFTNNPEFRTNMGGVFYQPGREYLPIPQNEVSTNTLYPQNPGYE